MLLGPLFEPFLQQRPVAVMARGILQRLLDPSHLDRVFEATAQQQYTRELLFSTLADLLSQVVLGLQPSVYAAYTALQEQIPVSDQAVYDKLQRVEPAVSQALVHDAAARAQAVIGALGAAEPSWLPGYRVKILDGNHLEATEHRLKELRTTWAAPLPGKGLAILDQQTGTVTDVLLHEDGQAQERSLLPDVLPLVRRDELWLGDRSFSTLAFMAGLQERQAAFVLRQHGSLVGELLGQRQAEGRCATGQVYEQRLRLRDGRGGTWVVRRITVVLDQPTSEGDTEIHLLTNLPAQVAKAARVAELYRRRWTIEGLFLEMALTLHCEIRTLAYPKAALLAFCLGLVAWNAVAVLKAALRAVHGADKIDGHLSGYYLALEVRQTYAGMMVAIPAVHWQGFGACSDLEMAGILKEVAGRVKLDRYPKHKRGPKKPPPKKSRYRNGAHVATAKLIASRRSRK